MPAEQTSEAAGNRPGPEPDRARKSPPPLAGKVAVVTGGSRGIGRAIVQRFARDGADVLFNYARREQEAAEVVRSAEELPGSIQAVRADLTEPDAADRLMQAALDQLGGLDILVNNAALQFELKPLAETETAVYDAVMAVNSRSVFLTMRFAARHMRTGGRIVNISTLNTSHPEPTIAPYAASKGAMEQLTAVGALELGRRGITVNTVSPGATETELLRHGNSDEALDSAVAVTPLGRLGQPEDIAAVVAYLASPEARWITGENIRATGGLR